MTSPQRRVALWIIVLCAVLAAHCAKSDQAEKQAPAGAEMEDATLATKAEKSKAAAPAAPGKVRQSSDESAANKRDDADRGLQSFMIAPMDLAKERLLEYRITLTYECKDLNRARQELLGIIAKYGYIRSSSATTETRNPSLDADLSVKEALLYDALRDFERLGILLNESITATDHTEGMVRQERTMKREQLRTARKNQSMGQVAPANYNWAEREASLERSENALDAAEHARWQIRDRVAWAQVHINLRGPVAPDYIDVPPYRNAFVGLANLLLRLVYVTIYLLPFIAIIAAIVWKRQSIRSIFKRT
ncbi:MAG TPA: DUF4349 domain-containing protein [Spirochaetota bacterium]|nr:DUF4349 domain-containing protein [Spirochaetota bacterium]HNT11147.1 DUF4349 domain-containing protein [Spirochaetota bacterium]